MLLLALALISSPPEPTSAPPVEHTPGAHIPGSSLRAYLRRPVPPSARFLDHGVIALLGAGGTPHLYRLDLRVGLFDHVSVGATAHWLPGQRAPQVWPIGALAFFRWQGRARIGVEVGAHYRPVMFPPPDDGHFVPRTHLLLTSIVVTSGWFSTGLDLGAAHTRIAVVDPEDTQSFRRRVVFAGGPFLRVGGRRFGVTADAQAVLSPDPLLVFELSIEGRFNAFEEPR